MTENQKAALLRLRRKLEIIAMDQRSAGSVRYHDTREALELVAIIEKEEEKREG